MQRLLKLNAFTITVIYLVFALLWILLSDQSLTWLTQDPDLISKYQTFKGIFYVLITGIFLYLLIDKSNMSTISQKERIDTALFAAGMATWSIDLKTRKIRRSKFHYKVFGLDRNPRSWSLETFYNSVHEDDRGRVKQALEETIKKEVSFYHVKFRVSVSGETRWMESRGNLIYDEHNEPIQLAGVISDITDQKKLEENYHREKELFESIFENIPVMIDITSDEMKTIRVNKTYEEVLGFNKNEVINKNIMDIVYPDPEIRQKASEAIKKADGSWNEFITYTKSGEKRIQQWANIRLSDGNTIGIGLDITEQKLLQKEHDKDRLELQKVYDNIPVMINLHNADNNVYRINKYFKEKVGYTNKELESINLVKEIVPDDKVQKEVFRHMETADGSWKDFEIISKSGDSIHTAWSNVKITETLSLGIGIDTTALKQKERALKELTERYRKAEEIANFGHWWRDLKNDNAIFSKGYYAIMGLKPNQKDSRFETSLSLIHPDDRDDYREAFEHALESGSLNVRYRVIKPNTGEIGYFQELAETEYDKEGNAVSISGTIQDTTEREEFQIALTKRNKFIETTLENIPIGVAVNLIDSGEATVMNKKFSEIYGWPKDVIKNVNNFFKKVYPDESYRMKIVEMVQADMNSKDPERMNWDGIEVTTQEGKKKIINAKNIPLYDQNLMISTVVDVTAQAEAEKRLAESEHNYRLLFQKSPQPMLIYDPESLKIIEVNNAAVNHYGYTRKEFYSMTLLDIRPKEDWDEVKKVIEKNRSQKSTTSISSRHSTKSGKIIQVKVTGSSINYFGHHYRLVLINDVTEQKKAEERVLASLVKGENKERARIAQELHDGLGQYLAAANMNLDAVKSEINTLSERKQNQFNKGLNLLQHAVNETTQISRNLLPRVVDDYGLPLAIESLVDSYSSSTDISIKYYQNVHDLELPREVQFNLYRIAQEGISNAVKYSEASKINVQLVKDELDLILTIDDNGKGFDTDSKGFEPGLGLQTIKTRAGALGGKFEFDTKPEKGTFLSVVVPINKY